MMRRMDSCSRRVFLGALGTTAAGYARINGANERLRIGIIGAGGMATAHMKALVKMRESDNFDILSVCDVWRKRLDAAAALTGARKIENYHRILEDKDVDYVLIATPEHWHFQMTMDALDAGKHVYVEKPMTHTIEQARKVVARLAAKPSLKLQVGVQGMSDNSYETAREYVAKGALGKVVLAQIDYSRNYRDDFWRNPTDPDARPGENLDWKAWLGPAPKRAWDPERFFSWRRYWDYSGGIATDLFIHRATRIIKALDLKFPDKVVATGGKFFWTTSVAEIPDTFNVLADYSEGLTMQLVSTMANDTPVDHLLRGKKATLEFTRTGFRIVPQRGEDAHAFEFKKTGAEEVDLHHRNLQAAIRGGEKLRCDAQLGLYGVAVCEMAVESYRRRQYLKWDPGKQKAVKA